MDADNRVVLNCGGIRHEVYKVICISDQILPRKIGSATDIYQKRSR